MTTSEALRHGIGRGHLLRVLGLVFGVAVVVGNVIGQGILRSPGLVAEGLGAPALIIGLWAIGGVITLVDSMSTVELAASIRQTGGPYTFGREAFGPLTGLALGICDWLANVAAMAYLAVVVAEYLHRLGVATVLSTGLVAALLTLVIGMIQLLGTRISGRTQEIGSAIKAALFMALIAILLFAPRGAPLEESMAPAPVAALTLGGAIIAMRAIFGAYAGWNAAAYFCEEIRDPGETIARGTFSGIVIVALIYVFANMAYMSVLSPEEMAASNLVAADAAMRVLGTASNSFVTAVSLVAVLTTLSATTMIFPRVLFAMSRDFSIPGLNVVAANGTPRAALMATIGAAALLATVGVYDLLLAFSASLLVALGMAVNVSAIVLRLRAPSMDRPWMMPLFPLPALAGLAVNAALFFAFVWDDPWTTAQAMGALAFLTALAWFLTGRARTLI